MGFDTAKSKRDRKAEVEGVWVPFGGGKWLVARATNPGYKSAINKALRDIDPDTDANELSMAEAISDEVMWEAAASHLLIGWKEVTDGGKAVKYTAKRAYDILEEHDDLYREIVTFASSRENYLVKRDATEAAKLGE